MKQANIRIKGLNYSDLPFFYQRLISVSDEVEIISSNDNFDTGYKFVRISFDDSKYKPEDIQKIMTKAATDFESYRNNKISVLDHGFVRLVDHMGSDLSIVRSARVSYDAAWRAGEDTGSDTRLINYLAKNHHTTPFESVEFQFEVKAPIFVFRQWHRHRTWSFNELSARYRELPEEYYVPETEQITTQSSSNKQMRTDEVNMNSREIRNHINFVSRDAFQRYKKLLEMGCPRELARSILPMGTYSHMFAKVDLLNLVKFINLRDHDHAQHEIRVYAQAMKELIKDIVPVSIKAWTEQ